MNHREMSVLAGDPGRVKSIAGALIKAEFDWRESDLSFLGDLTKYDATKLLSERQREYFYRLMTKASRRSAAGKYRASTLVSKAWAARYDLGDEDAENWLDELHSRGNGLALSKPEWRWLINICKHPELTLIPADEWVELKWSFGGLSLSS